MTDRITFSTITIRKAVFQITQQTLFEFFSKFSEGHTPRHTDANKLYFKNDCDRYSKSYKLSGHDRAGEFYFPRHNGDVVVTTTAEVEPKKINFVEFNDYDDEHVTITRGIKELNDTSEPFEWHVVIFARPNTELEHGDFFRFLEHKAISKLSELAY